MKDETELVPDEPELPEIRILPPIAERIPAGSLVYMDANGKLHRCQPSAQPLVIVVTDEQRAQLADEINTAPGRDVF